jgi:hypothetical protein
MLAPLLLAIALQAQPLAEALDGSAGSPAASPSPTSAPSTQADPLRGDWGKPSGRRVSLSSSLSVNEALERIADAAGWSLIIEARPRGEKELELRLKSVPVEDAFRAVLSQAGLVAERRGELVTVRGEGLLPGILPPDLGREAERATQQALAAARRAMQDAASADQDEDVDDDHHRDRHAAGADVIIAAGEVVRDAVTWRGDIRLQPAARARNLAAFRGKVHLGPQSAAHDAVAFGGDVDVGPGARVSHDVAAIGGDVAIGAGSEVLNDAVAIGGTVRVQPGGRVHGSIHSIPLPGMPGFPRHFRGDLIPPFPGPITFLFQTLVTFAVLFVLGLVMLAAFPGRLQAVSAALSSGPLRSLFAGLLGTVGMIFLTVLLVLTVIGLLLVPFQLLAVLAGGLLGTVAFASYVGRILPFPRSRRTMVLELAAGTLLFSALVHIPVLGGLVWLATWCLGFGAVLRTRFGATTSAAVPTPTPPPVLPTTPAT